jgi:hypothetical protein
MGGGAVDWRGLARGYAGGPVANGAACITFRFETPAARRARPGRKNDET